jgi:hypothetical protein
MANTSTRASRRNRLPVASVGGRARFLQPLNKNEIHPKSGAWKITLRHTLGQRELTSIQSILDADDAISDKQRDLVVTMMDEAIQSCWDDMSKAWNRPLTFDDRSQIQAIVDEYLAWQPFEASAPFAADSLKALDRIEQAALEMAPALSDIYDHPLADAASYVGSLLDRYLGEHGSPGARDVEQLLAAIVDLTRACGAVRSELEAFTAKENPETGFVEGQAWRAMICSLSDWGKRRGFPTGISKDLRHRANDAPPSHFVAFVWALQKAVPPACRRHTQSIEAFASAMSNARSAARKARTGA